MHLIKVDAIDSTNSYARELFRKNAKMPSTCIVARQQLQGRGQRGTTWQARPGMNLTFSLLFPSPRVSPGHQFLISASVATEMAGALEEVGMPKIKLKWPNDIMSANYKIGGILIENIISENQLAASIIGVGLNVNQTDFPGLPAASSMKLVSGHHFSLEELQDRILPRLEQRLGQLSDAKQTEILKEYTQKLFRRGLPSTFQLPDKTFFTGMIVDVSLSGKLLVKIEADQVQEFDLKEVRLCY